MNQVLDREEYPNVKVNKKCGASISKSKIGSWKDAWDMAISLAGWKKVTLM